MMRQAFILAFLLGASAEFPGFEDRRYPTCTVVDYKQDVDTNSRHAIHKCKDKAGDFKCSTIVLDDCVAVNNDNGLLFVRGSRSDVMYKTLASNCPFCSYYGYSMSLYCLCGGGDRPVLYEASQVELSRVFTNNNGILGNNNDITKKCVAREIECPKDK